jgi:hypothetical protein
VSAPSWRRRYIDQAITSLRATDEQLCGVVAAIATDRGWDGNGKTYQATPPEQVWHDRIHCVRELVGELVQELAASETPDRPVARSADELQRELGYSPDTYREGSDDA